MAVKLRLARHGSKKRPYYRIVAANNSARRDGRFLEHVGSYDPAHQPVAVSLKRDRITYWLSQGALPTDTVKNILSDFMDKPDTAVRPVKREVKMVPPPPADPKPAPAPAAEVAPAAEAAPVAEAAPAAEAAAGDAPADAS